MLDVQNDFVIGRQLIAEPDAYVYPILVVIRNTLNSRNVGITRKPFDEAHTCKQPDRLNEIGVFDVLHPFQWSELLIVVYRQRWWRSWLWSVEPVVKQ